MCKGSKALCGIAFLIAGILYILKDLGAWNVLGIKPWPTAVFILLGICMLLWGDKKK